MVLNNAAAATEGDRDNSDNWDLAWNALQRMVDRLYPDYCQ
ncbi:hypothetical protein [Rhodococcus sp. 1R11]|nr:hypothetical protein [Rhodococcus sp. 1R11]